MNPRDARPKKHQRVEFHAAPTQIERWKGSAKRIERTLAAWIRLACDFALVEPALVQRRSPRNLPSLKLVRFEFRATGNQAVRWQLAADAHKWSRTRWIRRACEGFERLPPAVRMAVNYGIPPPRRPSRKQ
jgi:hypothetical protein